MRGKSPAEIVSKLIFKNFNVMCQFLGNSVKSYKIFRVIKFKYFNVICHKMDNYFKNVKKHGYENRGVVPRSSTN